MFIYFNKKYYLYIYKVYCIDVEEIYEKEDLICVILVFWVFSKGKDIVMIKVFRLTDKLE